MTCAFPFAVHSVPILLSVYLLVVHVFCLNLTHANMSVSGEIYEKSEETEKKEHIDKMVKWLQLNTSLKVLEEHEFDDLAHKASIAEHDYAFSDKKSSVGCTQTDDKSNDGCFDDKVKTEGDDGCDGDMGFGGYHGGYMKGKPGGGFGYHGNMHSIASFQRPRIPTFSGEEKSEVTFEVWKYEVTCIINDGSYPDTVVLQCIRNSLKGKTRALLLTLPDATPKQLVDKLDGVYGNVYSSEAIFQQFYMQSQEPGQSVSEYGMKLECLLQSASQKEFISPEVRNTMLRTKLWSGLTDAELKNQSRYKYECTKDFDTLRKELRKIELDIKNSPKSSTSSNAGSVHHNPIQSTSSCSDTMKTLREIVGKLDGLTKRMSTMESKVEGLKGNTRQQHSDQGHDRFQGQDRFEGQQYQGQQSRGGYRDPYRGGFRGQVQGRGDFRGRGARRGFFGRGRGRGDLNW